MYGAKLWGAILEYGEMGLEIVNSILEFVKKHSVYGIRKSKKIHIRILLSSFLLTLVTLKESGL